MGFCLRLADMAPPPSPPPPPPAPLMINLSVKVRINLSDKKLPLRVFLTLYLLFSLNRTQYAINSSLTPAVSSQIEFHLVDRLLPSRSCCGAAALSCVSVVSAGT